MNNLRGNFMQWMAGADDLVCLAQDSKFPNLYHGRLIRLANYMQEFYHSFSFALIHLVTKM